MPLLGRVARLDALPITALARAVDVPVIAVGANVHDEPAVVANTLNLPKIEHPTLRDRRELVRLRRVCDNSMHRLVEIGDVDLR